MKKSSLIVGALLLSAATANAADFSIFVTNKIGVTPAWPTYGGNVGGNVQVDMLSANSVRWTVSDIDAVGSSCNPASILNWNSNYDTDGDVDGGGNPAAGKCTYFLDIAGSGIVQPGWSVGFLNLPISVTDFEVDQRWAWIYEISSLTFTNTSGGNNSTIDQSTHVDGSKVTLLLNSANTIGMRVEVLSGNTVRWSDDYAPGAGSAFNLKLPNSTVCKHGVGQSLSTTVRVSELAVFNPSAGVQASTASEYTANCVNS